MDKIDRKLCPHQKETMHLYGARCTNPMVGISNILRTPNGNLTGTDYHICKEDFCERIEDYNCPWVIGKRIERLEKIGEELWNK